MKREQTRKGYHKVKNVSAHLDSHYNRMWAHFVETATESYYLLNGEKLTPAQMDSKFPIVELEKKAIYKGNPLDGRTNFY